MEAANFVDSGETKIGDPIIALSVGYVSFGMVTSQPYLSLCDGSYRRINTDIIGKNVTDALAKELGMPKGIIVMQTEEGSPAMQNGIQPTDVITALDDSSVESVQDYMNILRKKKPGDTISVNFWRKWKNDYKETKITITLAKR